MCVWRSRVIVNCSCPLTTTTNVIRQSPLKTAFRFVLSSLPPPPPLPFPPLSSLPRHQLMPSLSEVAFLSGGSVIFHGHHSRERSSRKEEGGREELTEVHLKVTGMTCGSCVANIEKSLGRLTGECVNVCLEHCHEFCVSTICVASSSVCIPSLYQGI